MRVGTAHEGRVQRGRSSNIVDEAALAGEQRRIFQAGDTGPNEGCHGRARVTVKLRNISAAQWICSLPRLRGRVGVGATLLSPFCLPPPPLSPPRARGGPAAPR